MKIQKIKIQDIEPNEGQISNLPKNPRLWTQTEVKSIAQSLIETPELLEARPIIVVPFNNKYIAIAGNLRLEGLKYNKEEVAPCAILSEDTPIDKLKAIVIKDNSTWGDWDIEELNLSWGDLPLEEWKVPTWESVKDIRVAPKTLEKLDDSFDETTCPNCGYVFQNRIN